jgi:hypothetical protein
MVTLVRYRGSIGMMATAHRSRPVTLGIKPLMPGRKRHA